MAAEKPASDCAKLSVSDLNSARILSRAEKERKLVTNFNNL